jgi:hypothetical protein
VPGTYSTATELIPVMQSCALVDREYSYRRFLTSCYATRWKITAYYNHSTTSHNKKIIRREEIRQKKNADRQKKGKQTRISITGLYIVHRTLTVDNLKKKIIAQLFKFSSGYTLCRDFR